MFNKSGHIYTLSHFVYKCIFCNNVLQQDNCIKVDYVIIMVKDSAVHLNLRISDELSKEIEIQMAILGYVRKTDYVRDALREKIARDKFQLESGSKYDVGEKAPDYAAHPKRFDTELMRALISNEDIQKVICDIVEKRLKEIK